MRTVIFLVLLSVVTLGEIAGAQELAVFPGNSAFHYGDFEEPHPDVTKNIRCSDILSEGYKFYAGGAELDPYELLEFDWRFTGIEPIFDIRDAGLEPMLGQAIVLDEPTDDQTASLGEDYLGVTAVFFIGEMQEPYTLCALARLLGFE